MYALVFLFPTKYLQEKLKLEKEITRKTAPFINIVLNQLASYKF